MNPGRAARKGKLPAAVSILPTQRRRPHAGDNIVFGRDTGLQTAAGIAGTGSKQQGKKQQAGVPE